MRDVMVKGYVGITNVRLSGATGHKTATPESPPPSRVKSEAKLPRCRTASEVDTHLRTDSIPGL